MTVAALKCLDWLDRNHKEVLAIILISTVIHFIISCLLVLGTLTHRRTFITPWLVSHMINIITMVIIFTCWTFMSFFIDLLMAIMFPMVAGLLLGLWIVMWREVMYFSTMLWDTERQLMTILKIEAEFKTETERTKL